VIKFKVRGNLRFLSHAEMLRVFHRVCVRAGIKVLYSQGFNPRPKLSLPLPKPVGIEVEDDLLCLRVHSDPRITDCRPQVADRLGPQLPEGCELLSVSIADAKVPFQPRAATYILTIREKFLDERLRTRIAKLLASERLVIQRRIDGKGNIRNVDVRPFVKSAELADIDIMIECVVTQGGSIRVDEILNLLELDTTELAAPIRRTKVQWQ
jgi:radical SAM-linked protein